MGRSMNWVVVHFVWSTWDRQPLISADGERGLHRFLYAEATRLGARVLAINGMPDHVHVLVQMPTTIAIGDFVKRLKGSSSHWMNHASSALPAFKWQGRYGAFSVSRRDIDRVVHYIARQKDHHAAETFDADVEPSDDPPPVSAQADTRPSALSGEFIR